jgi:hypothetical protein
VIDVHRRYDLTSQAVTNLLGTAKTAHKGAAEFSAVSQGGHMVTGKVIAFEFAEKPDETTSLALVATRMGASRFTRPSLVSW